MFLQEFTGRGVRVAVIDSGVHADHPHVGGVEQGVAIRDDGTFDENFVDWLGHGTAVTAVIREKAPDAAIVAIKVFWRSLSTDVGSLVAAVDVACSRRALVINLSLGTANAGHRLLLEHAVVRAQQHGAIIAAAVEQEIEWLPGSLDGVIPVALDWSCPRDEYRIVDRSGRQALAASGYPRDIPDVPRERNLKGISFAVANASGFLARACEASRQATGSGPSLTRLWATLADAVGDGARRA